MKLFSSENPILIEMIFSIVFLILGFLFTLCRKRIVEALVLSNKVFWNRLGFSTNDKVVVFLSNIFIPVIGIVYSVVGVFLIYRVIYKIIAFIRS